MPGLRALVGGSVFAVALLLQPIAGSAQQPQINANAGVGATAINNFPPTRNFSLTSRTGPLFIPETTVSANSPGSSGTGTIVGSAEYGRLSARTSGVATAAGMFDLGASNALVSLVWIDYILVTGPPFTNVTFRLRLVTSGSVSGGPPSACGNVAAVSAQAAISIAVLEFRRSVPGGSCNGPAAGEADQTTTFTAPAGTFLPFIGTLIVSTAVEAIQFITPPVPTAEARAEGAVVSVELVALTPGGGYTSASGTRYTGGALPAPPVIARVESVSGNVVLRTPLDSQALATGGGFAPGSLIQTASNGTATLTFDDGHRLVVDPDTQVTLLPPSEPTVSGTRLSQVRGLVRHTRPAGASGAESYLVQTPTASVRPTGTEFTTRFSQTNNQGSLVVAVQQGTVEVARRGGQLSTLVAGAQGSFDEPVPRVNLILPVTGGSLVPGKVNTFSWTSFPAAVGYRIEYTANGNGFAQANRTTPEVTANTINLPPGSFTTTGGTVDLALAPIPVGTIPAGLTLHWRVFPTNAAGAIIPGSTSSDASTFTVQGGRVTPTLPSDGSVLARGTSVTFAWTSVTGAAGYLFEFTLNAAGFAQPNATQVESSDRAIRLGAGAFTTVGGSAQIVVPIPAGVVPAGTRAFWRVYPTDAAGRILPFTTASDARGVVFQ